ncbi:MAG: hypothetical protein LBM64_01195 [Deltaproteobacteria bacterium]|nr:hypothetical protein [Deltaproteobacteria bacterium]
MSGENNEYKSTDYNQEPATPTVNETPADDGPEAGCAWLKHCETNLFGVPDDEASSLAGAAGSGFDSGFGLRSEDVPLAAHPVAGPAAAARPAKVKKPKERPPVFPRLKAEPRAPATLLSRLFDICALAGPLVLTALLLAQMFFPLQDIRPLWAPGETVFADILRGVLNGDWLILNSNGQVYFDAPPLYFWFLAGVHYLLSLPGADFLLGGSFELADKIAASIFVGSALSGLLLLWATLFMARGVANFDRRGVFAAGAVLLGLFLFAGTLHYGSQDLFFCALVVAGQAFLFKGLRRSSSMFDIGLGFAFASLAFLAKGLPGLLLPLLCSVLFAFWQGRPWRLLHKDFLLGFIFSLLPVLLWVGVIWADGHYEVVVRIIREQFIGAILLGWDYSGPWWYYLGALPVLLLPWVFLAIFPNWPGLASRETALAAKEAFRGSRQGLAFVWLALLCALFSFFLLSLKSPLDILLLFAPLSIVAGRIILGLSPLRNMLLQRILAVFFLVLAFAFAVLPVYFSGRAESVLGWLGDFGLPVLGVDIGGVFIISLAFLAAGCLLIGPVNARRPESTLLVVLVLVVGISCPLAGLGAPSLGKLLSPAENGQQLERYVEHGYTPLAWGVDGAPFAYYANSRVGTATEEALRAGAEGADNFILLTSRPAWENLEARSELALVESFRLAGEDYLLLTDRPLPEEEAEGASMPEAASAVAPETAPGAAALPVE